MALEVLNGRIWKKKSLIAKVVMCVCVCVCVVFLMEFVLSIMLRWSVGPPHSRPIISPEKGHLPPGHGGYRSQESQDGHHDSGGEVS